MHRLQALLELKFLKRLPTGTILLFIFLIAIVLVVILFNVAPAFMDTLPIENTDRWNQLASFTTIVGFAFAFGAGIMLLIDFSEAVNSRNLEIYRDIYEKFMSDEQIESRRYIYLELPNDRGVIDKVKNDPEAKEHVKNVLNLIDYLGFLVQQGWVREDAIIGWLSPVVVKVWQKIEPVVLDEIANRPEEPDYYEPAVELAKRCKKWREDHYPKWKEIEFSDARL